MITSSSKMLISLQLRIDYSVIVVFIHGDEVCCCNLCNVENHDSHSASVNAIRLHCCGPFMCTQVVECIEGRK